MSRALKIILLSLGLTVLAGIICHAQQPLHVISDANYKTVMAQGVAAGHGTGWNKTYKTKLKLAKFADVYGVIPRAQWPALVKQGQGAFLSDLIKAAKIPSKDQDGLGYCWVYASVATVETERACMNLPYVALSPESVGGPINNWRNAGGNGLDALDQLTKVGCCPNSYMDSANSLSPSRWKTGWQAECAKYKVTCSWADVSTFDEVFTALLMRMPVSIGLDWWGHQVELTDPYVFSDGSFGVVMRNSWGEDWPSSGAGGWSTLTEGRSQPDGSFAAVSATVSAKPGQKVTPISIVNQRAKLMKALISAKRGVVEGCKP